MNLNIEHYNLLGKIIKLSYPLFRIENYKLNLNSEENRLYDDLAKNNFITIYKEDSNYITQIRNGGMIEFLNFQSNNPGYFEEIKLNDIDFITDLNNKLKNQI